MFVIGYAAATSLGAHFDVTWARAVRGESGLRRLTRFVAAGDAPVVGEIPDFDPLSYGCISEKDVYQWDARNVLLTLGVCSDALAHARLEMNAETAPRTACLIGSAVHGADALRTAFEHFRGGHPFAISPSLLPNLCANVAGGLAGMRLGFTGPLLAPQAACATGNYAIGLGARLIAQGDCDFALAGGVESPLVPEVLQGLTNMGASIKLREDDRAYQDPAAASRPFSVDRRGFALAEGAGVLVLAAEDALRAHGLTARAEICGVGWSSDATHFAAPHAPTITRAIRAALSDAELGAEDISVINAHGTSTRKGDAIEVHCLREVFGQRLAHIPVLANKSQLGHSQSACGAIEAALTVEGLQQGLLLPTLNYIADPELGELDVVAEGARRQRTEIALSTALGFGGTNCCLVLRGV